MKRYSAVIKLKAQHITEYRRIHANVWPAVLETISACNICNYTIFLREPENLLFGVYEYHGTNHASDMAKMAADPATREWWALCMPMQEALDTRGTDEWWAAAEEVFHQD